MLNMNLRKAKVVVTGGAGFIGSHLTDRLIRFGANVTVIDNLSYGKQENINKKAHLLKLDINDYESLKYHIGTIEPTIIYHLAAIATTKESSMGWKDAVLDCQVNAIGTLNILRSVISLNVSPKIIFTSSAAVYGNHEYTPIDEKHPTNPVSPYGISKLSAEKYIMAYHREYGAKSTILRVFNTYGPRQPRYVMFDLLKKLKQNPNELEVIGTGNQVRDYCYIDDTVTSLFLALSNKSNGEIYNVGSGNPLSVKQIAEMIVKLRELEGRTIISYTGESWKGDLDKLHADISKIKSDLGFEPSINIGQGLKGLIRWFDGKYRG